MEKSPPLLGHVWSISKAVWSCPEHLLVRERPGLLRGRVLPADVSIDPSSMFSCTLHLIFIVDFTLGRLCGPIIKTKGQVL